MTDKFTSPDDPHLIEAIQQLRAQLAFEENKTFAGEAGIKAFEGLRRDLNRLKAIQTRLRANG